MGLSKRWALIGAAVISCLVFFLYEGQQKGFVLSSEEETKAGLHSLPSGKASQMGTGLVPDELMGVMYRENDFINDKGIAPTFWECQDANCSAQQPPQYGPCFAPHESVDWNQSIDFYKTHPPRYMRMGEGKDNTNDLADLCRPGFLIIGAGKCGTSSLYQYITAHPRVLPAKEKQIHYFKYYLRYPMQWYLKHFPTATSFLASGALMTGEASPGYLPYPDVVGEVKRRLPEPKIIALGREPLDRAWSSYRYNYANPLLDKLRKGAMRGIKKSQPDETYRQYLFSFEDLVKAELAVLRECFADNSPGVVQARKKYENQPWARKEMKRRKNAGEPPMIDLDEFCYGGKVSETVPRKQWKDLVEQYPDKIIDVPNLHLVQSLIGRGLYTFPLEWWYAGFQKEQIYFMCTEELSDLSGAPLNELGGFLGLPAHNFSSTVAKGAYNVGGHKGYDKEVSWETIQQESKPANVTSPNEIPLSPEVRKEVDEFVRPINERLFALTGHRCDW